MAWITFERGRFIAKIVFPFVYKTLCRIIAVGMIYPDDPETQDIFKQRDSQVQKGAVLC